MATNRAPACTLRESQAIWRMRKSGEGTAERSSTPSKRAASVGPMRCSRSATVCFRSPSPHLAVLFRTSFATEIVLLICAINPFLSAHCQHAPECRRIARSPCSRGGLATPPLAILRGKTAANQDRVQSEPQARLGYFTHRFPGKVRHRNFAALVHGHRHFRQLGLGDLG